MVDAGARHGLVDRARHIPFPDDIVAEVFLAFGQTITLAQMSGFKLARSYYDGQALIPLHRSRADAPCLYSTVTDFARLRG